MTLLSILGAVGVLLAGLLAGIEFVVRYGVQPSLTALDDRAHLAARQSLVRRLRILVPAVMVPTVLLAVAVLVASASASAGAGTPGDAAGSPALAFRIATVAALAAFLAFAFLGTVPINIQVDSWNLDAPPADWKAVVRRWQRIDVFRSSAALLAFAFATLALALP
ncbi:hypothetical protein VD659_04965 [Herbiconiux sp. 11R-BC]|uniref:hypothetical protein n=1 Tax=Herbiconiux sp. 11R-BC TaxID=3111637 RepID=UPI003C0F52C6